MIDQGRNVADIHVGSRLRSLRRLRGLSLDDLASQMNITYQQVQKYETGTNRISAGRLYDAARILKVSPGHFFHGLPGVDGQDIQPAPSLIDEITDAETRVLIIDLIERLKPKR